MAEESPSTTPREPARSRFRLPHWGWLLVATAMLVVGYVGLSFWLPYHRQQTGIREIKRIGGSVELRHAVPPWIQRAVAWIGLDPWYEVWQADFRGSRVADAELVLLHRFPNIESVWLHDTNVSDAGLDDLQPLAALRMLDLSETNVSNAGLIRLKPLAGLRELVLDRTLVTSSGMIGLADLHGLQRLSLVGTDFSNSGLFDLRKLTSLEHLNLSNTLVNDSGVRQHLTKMQNLKSVCLRGSAVTDKGIAELKRALPGLVIEP